jgi:hypothetical protein
MNWKRRREDERFISSKIATGWGGKEHNYPEGST